MQHGHVDELVKSRIDREIAEAKAAQQPTLDPTAEPVVTILFTESPDLEMGQQMPLHEADALFARLDAEHRGGGYYDKTDFRIDFTFQGEPHSYSGRQDFGDRDGSLIEHIREYQTFYLNDEKWKDHLTRQGGPEAWAEDHASREAFLTEIIPYMELHCNLSRLEQEAQTRLASSDTLTPEETAYYGALVDYAMECRPLLNHGEPLPEMPKLTDFDQSLQDYKAQVEAEIAQEAADAGMTLEQYAAAGYEAPEQDSFSIYQIKSGDETRDYRFEPYDRLQATADLWTGPTMTLFTPRRWIAKPRWRTFTVHSTSTIRQISRDIPFPCPTWWCCIRAGKILPITVTALVFSRCRSFYGKIPCVPPSCPRNRTKT